VVVPHSQWQHREAEQLEEEVDHQEAVDPQVVEEEEAVEAHQQPHH
jgi:hypothetical protein